MTSEVEVVSQKEVNKATNHGKHRCPRLAAWQVVQSYSITLYITQADAGRHAHTHTQTIYDNIYADVSAEVFDIADIAVFIERLDEVVSLNCQGALV